ncbi:hypothetical protein UH38_15680 [Aliterella atlantica CENA595]|uniref:Uncharacterized protein n=2 Tax=Aliterella TaxID=1827277 RepID=A0A0D8ZUB9_9CYAN|nr:hypothetical protein UH38_15680 [Aliterella atlantica CENA595]
MTSYQPDRLNRIEESLERSTQLLERVVRVQERMLETQSTTLENQGRTNERIEILLDAATRHESTISRLDAILERLIYREGRNGGEPRENE